MNKIIIFGALLLSTVCFAETSLPVVVDLNVSTGATCDAANKAAQETIHEATFMKYAIDYAMKDFHNEYEFKQVAVSPCISGTVDGAQTKYINIYAILIKK